MMCHYAAKHKVPRLRNLFASRTDCSVRDDSVSNNLLFCYRQPCCVAHLEPYCFVIPSDGRDLVFDTKRLPSLSRSH